jgi:putative ABC transport system permease protein
VLESFPGLPADRPFIIVSREQLAAVQPGSLPALTTIYVGAPDGIASEMRAVLGPRTLDTAILSRFEIATRMRAAPLEVVVAAGIGVAATVAILCAALAVGAAIFLSASARGVELSHLLTLGLTGRQSAALIAAEFAPAVLVALLAGAGLGLGLFLYIRPGLGLGTIAGSQLETPAAVALPQLVMLFVATVVAASLAVAVGAMHGRSASPAADIRKGMES